VALLDEITETLGRNQVQLATNIHSFPECSLDTIAWWLSLLREHGVRFLMVVPNGDGTRFLCAEPGGARLDFFPSFQSYGYKLIAKRPKYKAASIQQYGVSPGYYYLFELGA
jgi:hypothetical protein